MAQSNITIREAGKEDFSSIREIALNAMLYRESISPIRDPSVAAERQRGRYAQLADQGLASFPADWDTAAFVAIDEASTPPEPVGYVLVMLNAVDDFTGEQQAYILDIAVRPERRGQGIGTKLMEKAHEYAREKGLRCIGLTVAAGNENAIRLYRELGYIEEWKRMARRL